MPQVLKDEVFERIFQAGVDVFYEKDYRSAKMQEIADKAGIPVSLIYNYHKNKEELFDKIASSLRINFEKIAAEEEQAAGLPSEKYRDVAEDYILDLLENHKIFVILMDKTLLNSISIDNSTKKRMFPIMTCSVISLPAILRKAFWRSQGTIKIVSLLKLCFLW